MNASDAIGFADVAQPIVVAILAERRARQHASAHSSVIAIIMGAIPAGETRITRSSRSWPHTRCAVDDERRHAEQPAVLRRGGLAHERGLDRGLGVRSTHSRGRPASSRIARSVVGILEVALLGPHRATERDREPESPASKPRSAASTHRRCAVIVRCGNLRGIVERHAPPARPALQSPTSCSAASASVIASSGTSTWPMSRNKPPSRIGCRTRRRAGDARERRQLGQREVRERARDIEVDVERRAASRNGCTSRPNGRGPPGGGPRRDPSRRARPRPTRRRSCPQIRTLRIARGSTPGAPKMPSSIASSVRRLSSALIASLSAPAIAAAISAVGHATRRAAPPAITSSA